MSADIPLCFWELEDRPNPLDPPSPKGKGEDTISPGEIQEKDQRKDLPSPSGRAGVATSWERQVGWWAGGGVGRSREILIFMSFTSSIVKKVIFGIGLVALSGSDVSCVKKPVNNSEGAKKMTSKTIEQVLEEHTDKWMSIPGVVGTAIGELKGKPCIKVLVVKKNEELKKKIPSQVEGFPVVIEETGEIRALEKS